MVSPKFYKSLSLVQGMYFTVTGIWPLLHYRSFEYVSGSKTDDWLVKTIGILIFIIGVTVLLNGRNKPSIKSILFPALSSAIGLGFISAYYSLNGTISKIYLVDAVVEGLLSLCWLLLILRLRSSSSNGI